MCITVESAHGTTRRKSFARCFSTLASTPLTIQTRLNAGETVHIAPRDDRRCHFRCRSKDGLSDVFDNRDSPRALFSAIIRSRDASLLLYGVQTMTSDTRAYLVKTPGIVQWLHGRAPIVAAFGGAFRVGADGRVVMPGGADAEELWEDLADEKVAQPDRFARGLFGRDGGRLAYFADTLWTLDEAHARFALGLWISDRRLRKERFQALYRYSRKRIRHGRSRTRHSPSVIRCRLLLSNLRLNDAGLLVAPAYRRLWERGVNGIDMPDVDDRQMREPAEDGVADAAFLAGLLAAKLPRDRQLTIERVDVRSAELSANRRRGNAGCARGAARASGGIQRRCWRWNGSGSGSRRFSRRRRAVAPHSRPWIRAK